MKKRNKANLKNFFYPKSIAIIGSSDNAQKVGGILLKKAIQSKAITIPVNPKYDFINGIKCFKSVLDYNKKIDLAVIAIPSNFVVNALEECGRKGIKEVIIITSGFTELGNRKAVESLKSITDKYGIRFIGTNCFGISNSKINLDLTFSSSMPDEGNISFISQSGALWSYLSDLSADKSNKLGFSSFVSLGNMEDLEFDDFLDYFGSDKDTKSIILYIEKLTNGNNFIRICKKISKKKKIIAVKGGSSSTGQKAEFSHTASLASDYEIYKGAFKQAGVILSETIEGAIKLASEENQIKLDNKKQKIGKNIFIITNAGGAGVLLSDHLSNKGFNIIEKPLDILGTATSKEYQEALDFVKTKDPKAIIVAVTPQSMTDIDNIANKIIEFNRAYPKISIVPVFLGSKSIKNSNEMFNKNNIMCFNSLNQAKYSLEF